MLGHSCPIVLPARSVVPRWRVLCTGSLFAQADDGGCFRITVLGSLGTALQMAVSDLPGTPNGVAGRQPYVVIGGGIAGVTCAQELQRLAPSSTIVLVSADSNLRVNFMNTLRLQLYLCPS
jgi:hypothetical protein